MKKTLFTFFVAILIVASCKKAIKETKESTPTKTVFDSVSAAFKIEILDDEALQIIDPNAKMEINAYGFTWTEGPLWVEKGKYLLFSDIPNNKVYKLNAENDTVTYLHPSGYTSKAKTNANEAGSNGLLLDKEGNLVLMQHGDRKVGRMISSLEEPKPVYETIIDKFEGKRFNSPNDGTFDADGNLYFTDPPYGLPKQMDDEGKELDFQGVYCFLKSGELVLLDKLSRPNGIAISPDGSSLFVAVSDPEHAVWYQYDIEAAGKVANKRIFYDVTHLNDKEGHQGLPDGMKMRNDGYLFASGPGGIWIFNQASKVLARIHTGQRTSNCALTGDGKRLFMTADDYVLSVRLK